MLSLEQNSNKDLKQILAFKDEKALEILKLQLDKIYSIINNFIEKVNEKYIVKKP